MLFENYAVSSSVSFWDRYAKWYELWVEHNSFHSNVLDLLYKIIEPGYKVLDIGAGNGVLALPLINVGCEVTLIEPSYKMRELLFKNAIKKETEILNVDPRRWEDIPTLFYHNYDLVIASNSLHLMDMPFEMALEKVFSLGAKVVLLVNELKDIKGKIKYDLEKYKLSLIRVFCADTSFAYHSLKEAYAHAEFYLKRPLNEMEKFSIYKKLVYKDGHFYHKTEETFAIYVWYRKI